MVLSLDASSSQPRSTRRKPHDGLQDGDALGGLWERFIRHHRLPELCSERPSTSLLERVCQLFTEVVPYENATKFLQRARVGPVPRTPSCLLSEHLEFGTGGTCYALSYSLRDLLVRYGFQAELCLGRVSDGPVTYFRPNHAAVLVSLGGFAYLADPGMLFRGVVRLPDPGESRVDLNTRETALRFSRPRLIPGTPDMVHVDLNGARGFTHRLSLELTTTGDQYFLRTWGRSFDSIAPDERLYLSRFVRTKLWALENRVFTVLGAEGVESSRWVTVAEAAFLFGFPRALVENAFALTPFSRKGSRIKQRLRFGFEELQRRHGRQRPEASSGS